MDQVLHLHLSDSQSFPLQLTTGHGPDITTHSAYSANQTYTVQDIAALHQYAASRGVTLIPEIDTPGHARSFGLAPGLGEIVTCANVYHRSLRSIAQSINHSINRSIDRSIDQSINQSINTSTRKIK